MQYKEHVDIISHGQKEKLECASTTEDSSMQAQSSRAIKWAIEIA